MLPKQMHVIGSMHALTQPATALLCRISAALVCVHMLYLHVMVSNEPSGPVSTALLLSAALTASTEPSSTPSHNCP